MNRKKHRTLFNTQEFLSRDDIEEHSVYLVNVSYSSGNPIHPAILFTGFKTGAYCEIYINNYESPVPIHQVYYLKVVTKLCSIPKAGCKLPPKIQDAEPIGGDW